MAIRYSENRQGSSESPDALMADIMRHYHARQYLGKAIIVTDHPTQALARAEKQWSKLSRALQQRRGRATNPIEILKYTYTIAAMQHMVFSCELPEYQPDAQVYLLKPAQLTATIAPIATLYITTPLPGIEFEPVLKPLIASGLLVDYCGKDTAKINAVLRPRAELETATQSAWVALNQFFAEQSIVIDAIAQHDSEAMDDAVDRLLAVDVTFLAQAALFQRALDLARPLITTPKHQRDRYEAAIMLAHRVQTFASTGFSAKFLHTYSNDDFLLNDDPQEFGIGLAEQIQRHMAAGRHNLVRALLGRAGNAVGV